MSGKVHRHSSATLQTGVMNKEEQKATQNENSPKESNGSAVTVTTPSGVGTTVSAVNASNSTTTTTTTTTTMPGGGARSDVDEEEEEEEAAGEEEEDEEDVEEEEDVEVEGGAAQEAVGGGFLASEGGGGGGMAGFWRQSRPSSPRMPPPEQPEHRPKSRHEPAPARYNNLGYWRARRVTFYKNGDPYFPGIEFR